MTAQKRKSKPLLLGYQLGPRPNVAVIVPIEASSLSILDLLLVPLRLCIALAAVGLWIGLATLYVGARLVQGVLLATAYLVTRLWSPTTKRRRKRRRS